MTKSAKVPPEGAVKVKEETVKTAKQTYSYFRIFFRVKNAWEERILSAGEKEEILKDMKVDKEGHIINDYD